MYGFLICFYMLDYCYTKNQENDLGGMLGAMSPDLLLDGMPIDKSFLDDWNRIVSELPDNDMELIHKIDEYLEFYENNFGFVFFKTRKMLRSLQVFSCIESIKEQAKETCVKHNY